MESTGPFGRRQESKLGVVVLDLDDTLVDTTRELVPAANREAARALIAAGVPGPLCRCERLRARFLLRGRQDDPDRATCRALGADESVAEAGRRAFYERSRALRRRGELWTIPGARTVLAELRARHAVVLLTWGHPATQWAKIRSARLDGSFDEIVVVDRGAGGGKLEALRALLQRHRRAADEVLVVGDGWEHEIRAGHRLGAWTCWVRRGSARGGTGWPPLTPDAEIRSPLEIPRVVRRIELRRERLTGARAAL